MHLIRCMSKNRLKGNSRQSVLKFILKRYEIVSRSALYGLQHLAIRKVYVCHFLKFCAEADVDLDLVFVRDLFQEIENLRQIIDGNVYLFQKSVNKQMLYIMVAGNHAVQKAFEFINILDVFVIVHADGTDAEIHAVCITMALFDENHVSV